MVLLADLGAIQVETVHRLKLPDRAPSGVEHQRLLKGMPQRRPLPPGAEHAPDALK